MINITVPELGESIIEGTLTTWLVKEGSSFQAGDNLAEIETEKIKKEVAITNNNQESFFLSARAKMLLIQRSRIAKKSKAKLNLVERVIRENIEEVILATSATVEGQTTAYYIQDSLKQTKTKITKLAQGLPVGGEIESLDDGTLYSAFKNRSGIKTNSD